MQRLHFAPAVGGQRTVESEIMQPGAPGDAVELFGIEATGVDCDLPLVERRLQSGMLLGGNAAVIVLGFGEAGRGASEYDERQDQRSDRANAGGRTAGHGEACRLARSPPRPEFAGFSSGLHSLRPSATPKPQGKPA